MDQKLLLMGCRVADGRNPRVGSAVGRYALRLLAASLAGYIGRGVWKLDRITLP